MSTPKIDDASAAIGLLGWIAFGIVQWIAIFDFFNSYIGLWWALAAPAALLVAWIPVIGTVAAVAGARGVWNWSWGAVMLLFAAPYIFFAVIALMGSLAGRVMSRFRSSSN